MSHAARFPFLITVAASLDLVAVPSAHSQVSLPTVTTRVLAEIQKPEEALFIEVSADVSTTALVLARSGKQFVLFNGARSPEYRRVPEIQLSSNGRHLAYSAETAEGQFVVNDGVPGTVYKEVFDLGVTSNGHVLYGFVRKGSHGSWSDLSRADGIVIDGTEYPYQRYERLSPSLFLMRNDSLRAALWDAGTIQPLEGLVFSAWPGPDGRKLGMVMVTEQSAAGGRLHAFLKDSYQGFNGGDDHKGLQFRLIVNGAVVDSAVEPEPHVAFSADGGHLTFLGHLPRGGIRLMHDERQVDAPVGTTWVVGSAGGDHFAVARHKLVTDYRFVGDTGVVTGTWPECPGDVWSLVYSNDGEHLAAACGRQVVIDGLATESFTSVSIPSFSGDGRHLVYYGFRSGFARSGHYVVVDTSLVRTDSIVQFDYLHRIPVFVEPRLARMVVGRDSHGTYTVTLLEIRLPETP